MLPNDLHELDQQVKAIVERGRKLLAAPIQTSCKVQNAFQADHYSRLNAILGEMGALDTNDPKVVVERAMSAFTEVEARAFVTRNVLENVKSGKSLTETLQSYHNVGLTDVNPARVPPPPQVSTRPKNGQLLMRMLRKLGEVAFCLLELVLSALKQVPGFVGIRPSLDSSGAFRPSASRSKRRASPCASCSMHSSARPSVRRFRPPLDPRPIKRYSSPQPGPGWVPGSFVCG